MLVGGSKACLRNYNAQSKIIIFAIKMVRCSEALSAIQMTIRKKICLAGFLVTLIYFICHTDS